MSNQVCHLTVSHLILAFGPVERLNRAGYVTIGEFFDAHGWDLTLEQIQETLDRDLQARVSVFYQRYLDCIIQVAAENGVYRLFLDDFLLPGTHRSSADAVEAGQRGIDSGF